MPLNEKAALGGAANLERSSQGSLGLSGALATPGSTDPPPINEKAASGWRPGRGVSKTAMEEGETSKCKSSLPSPTLQAQAALKPEAAPSELGAAHG